MRVSFLEAMAEFRAEGRGGLADGSLEGDFLRAYALRPLDGAEFAAYVAAELRRAEGEGRTVLWYVEGDAYLGRLSIRHRPGARELRRGGHIGYNVRPSARGRGHATAILRAALPVAHALGIDPALLTCDAGNAASRRVIERCGGVLAEQDGEVLRYWVRTG